MSVSEVFGYLGLLFLIFSISQDRMGKLRVFNLVATCLYLVQAILLNSFSLIITDLILLGVNGFKIFKKKR